jgi:site-specific DNA recombinase
MKVAIYLRVSTLDQATRGNTNRDGFSIPAQREACRRKAQSLNTTVIKEYVDRGESARSAARPALQQLLQDLVAKKDFDYVIVHKLDRLARNLHDDVMIGLAIEKSGAKLVSVTENIDETPSGRLLHGIMATIAEFYSRNLAAEALKGATEKAKQGGTPYQAPIGYLNVTERINQREARTVIVDVDRAPLIRWAFERYSTGEYSQQQIMEELAIRGLRTRQRAKSKIAPLSHTGVNKMFNNRYYLGYLKYRGIEYKGNHQPLVTPAVFSAIEEVRAAHYPSDGKRKHYHYLSRLLICSRCGRHLTFDIGKKRYFYYICINRRYKTCDIHYIPAQLIEKEVESLVAKLKFSSEERLQLIEQVSAEMNSESLFAELDLKTQNQRLSRLQAEQENLLKAYYDNLIKPGVLKNQQKRIAKEIRQVSKVISEAESRLEVIVARKDRALKLAKTLNFGKAFKNTNPIIKRHFCNALFSTLKVENESTQPIARLGVARNHNVRITKVNWHESINIHHLSEALIVLSRNE